MIENKTAWDNLTLPEQAAMMRVAVKNGIYNLQDIRQKYNEFAEGGKKEDEYYSTMEKVDKGWMHPLEALFNPVGKNILRGKKWQSYILDQNDALLPKYDTVVDMVIHRPEEAKAPFKSW